MKTKIIFSILAVSILLALVGCVQIPSNENTINVKGDAELTVDPDEAEVWMGISIIKDTAEEAQSEANKIVNDVIDGLRYKGFTEGDMETERISLYEEREWDEGTSTIVGWRATQTIKVKTIDMNKIGTIVDVAVENGANQINNINFGLSEENEQEYKKQALTEAAQNAKDKAETIAEGLGVRLGKIKTVSESNYYIAPYRYAMAETAGDAMIKEATNILPQEVTVTASISIQYLVG